MLKSHYAESHSNGRVGRVEFLPIYWYDALRNEAVGKSALIDTYCYIQDFYYRIV